MELWRVRNMNDDAIRKIRQASRARGLTVGEYLIRLVTLHERLRALAETEPRVQVELEALGLQSQIY